MAIESGTTSWWRNGNLMFLGLLVGFGAYFAYDGFYGWPRKNLEWAAEPMRVQAADLRVNPHVRKAAWAELAAELKERGSLGFNQLVDELKGRFGEPTLSRADEYWWVGEAMYAKAFIRNGQPDLDVQFSRSHEESSIQGQKYFALALGVGALLMAVRLFRIVTTRVVLDENGLRYNRLSISWEAMTGLRTELFDRKSIVDLEYTAGDVTRSIRLDGYHIDKFEEILKDLCARKSFPCPIQAPKPADGEEEDIPPPQE